MAGWPGSWWPYHAVVAQAVVGIFRDGAPQVARAELLVVGTGVVVRPLDRRGYPDGFLLASSSGLSMWEPSAQAPASASGPMLVPRRLLDRFQGGAGPWLLLEAEPGVSAFRPDDWSALRGLLAEPGIPLQEARPSQRPPEPNGGVLLVAMLASIGAFFTSLLAVGNIPNMADPNNLAVAAAAIVLWLLAGGAVLVAPAVSRSHRRRHPQAFARDAAD